MANAFDADDDGDAVLDNDDPDSRGPQDPDTPSFWVFSNFHQEFEDSLNANAMTVSKAMVDAALVKSAGLAMQVASSTATVELDCGTLTYCAAGGTGRLREPYPDGVEFPEGADPDGNGFGTVTAGGSGDVQLRAFGDVPASYPASEHIAPGDVYLQRYTDATGKLIEVPGMLNFVFHTTPAVKAVETGVRTYAPTYPVTADAPGSRMNPFHVPTTGDVVVTFTVWRPQRPGIAAAGEAPLMDLGNLRLVANLPNGPCAVGAPGPCQSGPGLCPGSSFATTDPHLTVVPDGIQDSFGDQAANPANTFTYSLDLSACLGTKGIAWNAGEAVMVPVQMMNVYGDNATQNVFFVRDDS
jgi:hypothetical protein